MPFSIVLNQINANNISENATISTGQNNQADWSWQGKNNIAAGLNVGLIFITNNVNIISDNDVIDTPVSNPEINNPQPNIQY
ncbi:hypothetical protein LS684_02875 [Cytobacillus spongiae]|jgi:formiminotetrahydrofolate cyclodeaminase|uniref:hypothetical protein n=1 Tax=Cytobacillus spongiae TaxID=2901381 RepID=UPI001F3A59FC|nr:hypothetical protein [Cytobacillus spongiae]UII56447.1 hypothetical protein LS684_02875 [Cytobacillus spongiae]